MNLSDKIKSLPHQPGVYLMRDATGVILYVGKARDLAKRVGTYFQRTELPAKVRSLIHCIMRIDYITASSERDALLLEQRLIKKYVPRYNVVMRDDKSYPFLKLTVQEDFPRLILTRKKINDGNVYFGPYPQVTQVRAIMRWMQKHFNLRPCKLDIKVGKGLPRAMYTACLYLHMHTCPAPCAQRISAKRYRKQVRDVLLFLKGDHSHLIRSWKNEMKQCSLKRSYEDAADIRDRLQGIAHLYERVSIQNIREDDLISKIECGHVLSELKHALALPSVPLLIEAFDISNLHGQQPVGSLVTFSYGMPKRSSYRLYHIRTVTGSNDTAMMSEIIFRRYRRLIAEGQLLPGLVLVDGGKPQLHAAEKVFSSLQMPCTILAALAKREEEIFRPGKREPIRLSSDSPVLLLLRRIRDEAHRFAINFHTKIRDKKLLSVSSNPLDLKKT